MQQVTGAGRQRGMVMVIGLIMLLAVTLMVVSASNLVQANLKVVQNVESRELTRAQAVAAIEEATSTLRFASSPTTIFIGDAGFCQNVTVEVEPDGSEVVGRCFPDYNGDGTSDATVKVYRPQCVSVTPRRNSDLDVFNSLQQASCYLPGDNTNQIVYSMCGDAVWEFRATATDAATGAETTIRQGVSVLTSLNNIATNCP
jgi:Tfp pilus assembly protein PilX